MLHKLFGELLNIVGLFFTAVIALGITGLVLNFVNSTILGLITCFTIVIIGAYSLACVRN